ncbi:MAG: hypothetical protein ACJ8F7_03230 [Gemmataceae bacterium]
MPAASQDVHTKKGKESDVVVPTKQACQAGAKVASVQVDSKHSSKFAFSGQVKSFTASTCTVTVTSTKIFGIFARLRLCLGLRTTGPDPGELTVTLTNPPQTPDPVPVNYTD